MIKNKIATPTKTMIIAGVITVMEHKVGEFAPLKRDLLLSPSGPLGHGRHTVAFVAPWEDEYFATLQFWHVVELVAPEKGEYFPALQSWHIVAPEEGEYFPVLQS